MDAMAMVYNTLQHHTSGGLVIGTVHPAPSTG